MFLGERRADAPAGAHARSRYGSTASAVALLTESHCGAMSNAGLESLATACSGALSAVAAKVIIYPLDWMKLRLSVKRPDESATSIVMMLKL